jgi:hypothetical protein
MRGLIGILIAAEVMLSTFCASADAMPEQVTFPSADGHTTLVGYLFVPSNHAGKRPAVVMMHGRAGAYSTNAKGRYDATTCRSGIGRGASYGRRKAILHCLSMASARAAMLKGFRASAMKRAPPNSTR